MNKTAALALVLALLSPIGCSSGSSAPSASSRLHLVAVLYGKYLSAHDGEMPQSQQDLVEFVEEREPDVLQRWGMKSAEEIFATAAGQPRVIVLYREHRQAAQTHFVAIEEQSAGWSKAGGQDGKLRWFAADVLGVAEPIREDEARRILGSVSTGVEKESSEVAEQADANLQRQQAQR